MPFGVYVVLHPEISREEFGPAWVLAKMATLVKKVKEGREN